MADQRTMAEFLRASTEGYAEAIVDRYKDLLCACPHHGFTELHQLDTFYNALNLVDQDSLNPATGGNLLERSTQDVLTIIENKSKGNPGYRPLGLANQIRPPGFAQPNVQTNQNRFGLPPRFNHSNEQSYQAPALQNQNVHLTELEKVRMMNKANTKPMQTQIDMVKNELRNEMKSSIQTSLSNQTNEMKNIMASLLQINTASISGSGSLLSNTVANPKGKLKAITTRSGLVINGPTIPTPSRSIDTEVDERVEETFTDPDLVEYTIKVPPPLVQKYKPPSQREFAHFHINITLADALILMPKYHKLLKALLSSKEKLQELGNTPLNKNCSTVILEKLPKKLGDPGKFLIPCSFSELKCKILADFGASINLMPLFVWKNLGLPKFIPTRMTLELANRAICTLAGITARALIDVHGEEMILHDVDEKGCNVLFEKLLDFDSTKDLHPPLHDNLLSGSPTYFPNPLLEEFADELPPEYDDNLWFDIEFDLKEIKFLLYQDKDSSLKDSIDQKGLANLANIFVDSIPEMFIDEYALDYSSPLIFDKYDDVLEVESDAGNVYDDPFDSKGEKIKESKLLIDELDLLCDLLPLSEYDSFISQDFSKVDALPSTNNEDKIFNPAILIKEKPVEIITHVDQDKKLAIFNASLVLEDFDPPFYEPLFFIEVPKSKMLLSFSSKNEEKVFKPGIHAFEKVHSYFIPELSLQGYKVFKINQIFKSPVNIFLFYYGKDTHILVVPYHHFYPLDQFKYGGIRIPENVKTLAIGFCTQVSISSALIRESCGCAISWASKKQTCITSLTMESKFVALVATCKEAEWLQNLLLETPLWFKPMAPVSICCDSATTVAKASIQMYNGKSRQLGGHEEHEYESEKVVK
uniref:Reverse transcriptase domain-containing protein n=1 Tax=Tanacetum cinerariifolium TaxID=118510 RepID=A0A699GGL9_TANCI|nr:hypothetical protein [Tanacetum cinerariifolium]